jgi:GMP synthase-like glutamine amidotransferase
MNKHYAIIETGLAPENLAAEFGDYLNMGQSLVSSCIPGATFKTYSPVTGESLPKPQLFDGLVVMGSEYSVYDQLDWIDELMEFVQAAAAIKIPLVGICFGHQLIAQALGGHVERKGWIVGAEDYEIDGEIDRVRLIAYHQDQVTRVPDDAVIVLANGKCPVAGLRYLDFPGWSIQSHPEFTVPFSRALIEHTRLEYITNEIADRAQESLIGPIKLGYVQNQIRAVLA